MLKIWIINRNKFLLLGLLLSSVQLSAQSAKSVKNKEGDIREEMIKISRQLGVTCTACHKTDNFKSGEMPTFKVAKEHMKLTQILIDKGMDGQLKDGKYATMADCYLCHRGKLYPDYKEPIHPMTNPEE